MASAYFYPYAVMQLPAGLLSDSLGPRKSVTAFLALAAAGSVLFGFAPSMEVAVAARVLVGLGVSMVFISAMKILSQWFRPREFAFMTGILATMGGVGGLTAAAPLALATEQFGWRAAFELIGVGTALIVVVVWAFVRDKPQDMGWPSIAEIDHVGPGSAALPMQIPLWDGVKRVLTEKRFWALAIWFFFAIGVFFAFGGLWAGPYLMHAYGMSRSEAGNILNMIAVGLIVGAPMLSLISDRVLKSRKKLIVLCTLGLVIEMAFLFYYPTGLSRWALYAVFFLFCIFCSAIVVIGFTATKELFPIEIAGTSVGTVNLFPFLGGAVMQVLLGLVLDTYPKSSSGAYPLEAYSTLLAALLAASVVALVGSLFIKETFAKSPS
jgi:sugar phosphate permease